MYTKHWPPDQTLEHFQGDALHFDAKVLWNLLKSTVYIREYKPTSENKSWRIFLRRKFGNRLNQEIGKKHVMRHASTLVPIHTHDHTCTNTQIHIYTNILHEIWSYTCANTHTQSHMHEHTNSHTC